MPDIVEVLSRLRKFAAETDIGEDYNPLTDEIIADILGLCDAYDSLRGMFETMKANVDSLIIQRNNANTELQRCLAGKEGLGIASTEGDSHADIKEKIRQGLIDKVPVV